MACLSLVYRASSTVQRRGWSHKQGANTMANDTAAAGTTARARATAAKSESREDQGATGKGKRQEQEEQAQGQKQIEKPTTAKEWQDSKQENCG